MRKVLLVLLVIAVVLLVTAECRRHPKRGGKKPGGGKGKGGKVTRPNKKACTRNCNICGQDGTCRECNDGFAKVTIPKRSKTVCVPCSKRSRKTGLNRDTSKCPIVPTTEPLPVCPKNCSSCENGVCLVCESGFALVTGRKNNTICIPCATGRKGKRVDKSQCGSESCGKKCLNCTNGRCTECKDGFELQQDKNLCKKKRDCGRGCKTCLALGFCSECKAKQDLVLDRKSRRCVKACSRADPNYKSQACEGKRKQKRGKKKGKGGKGGKRKPNRKTPPYPTQPTAEPH